MDFEDFRKDFLEEVKADASTSGLGSVATFVQTASSYMLNSDVFPDAITPAYYEGEGKRHRKIRVDGYLFDPADNTMNLFIADYDPVQRDPLMTRTLAQGFFNKIAYFVEEACSDDLPREIEPSSPASDLVDDIRADDNPIAKYRFVILSTRDMGERAIKFDAFSLGNIQIGRAHV